MIGIIFTKALNGWYKIRKRSEERNNAKASTMPFENNHDNLVLLPSVTLNLAAFKCFAY